MKTVLAFGCFDILHPGHILYLEEARKHGDELIVVIARDRAIRKGKGREPVFNERERRHMVGSLALVDKAILGGRKDRYEVIARIKPDVIALGYDQREDERRLKAKLDEMGLRARVVRIKKKLEHTRLKSSKVIDRIRKEIIRQI
ncbi:MAG: FAD synthase [Candidatus Micrarchaeota archaeon]|nr:FAD synthase [Candidatus Micrarchaeota archaeon]